MSASVGQHTQTFSTVQVLTLDLPSVNTAASGSTFFVGGFSTGNVTQRIPTDSKSNTFAVLAGPTTDSVASYTGSTWYCEGGAGGSSHVVTVRSSGVATTGVLAGYLVEIVAGAAGGVLDQAPAGLNDTSSPFTTNTSGTTTQADEIAILYYSTGTTAAGPEVITWGNGFTQIDAQGDGNFVTGGTAYKVLSSTGTVQGSITSAGAGTTETIGFVATFKAGAPVLRPNFSRHPKVVEARRPQ